MYNEMKDQNFTHIKTVGQDFLKQIFSKKRKKNDVL